MNLLEHLNACCRRLWRDESGVVLAFTVIVFLSLFVIGVSVHAVGESIRQRIELQNAADAAAYSAAVVQADALSRIAAINKAMAWTYVQMGRAEMNYDLDVWLQMIVDPNPALGRWNQDYQNCLELISPYQDCPVTDLTSWIGLSTLLHYPICQEAGSIKINGNQSKTYSELYASWVSTTSHWRDLQPQIDQYRQHIQGMNSAECDIVHNLKSNVEATIRFVLRRDVGGESDPDYTYSVVCSDASGYFTTLADETTLLQYFDNNHDGQWALSTLFGPGIDTAGDAWFKNLHTGDGIQRGYGQQPQDTLRADWKWHLEGWQFIDDVPVHVGWFNDGSDTVRGVDGEHWLVDRTPYYKTEPIKAQILTQEYFANKGAILVGVGRQMRNPFAALFGSLSTTGLFTFFEPADSDEKQPYTWSAAVARAGYLDGDAGHYNPMASVNLNNLSAVDWDSELIPLKTTDLRNLWEASQWQPVFAGAQAAQRGLQTLACGTVPAGEVLH